MLVWGSINCGESTSKKLDRTEDEWTDLRSSLQWFSSSLNAMLAHAFVGVAGLTNQQPISPRSNNLIKLISGWPILTLMCFKIYTSKCPFHRKQKKHCIIGPFIASTLPAGYYCATSLNEKLEHTFVGFDEVDDEFLRGKLARKHSAADARVLRHKRSMESKHQMLCPRSFHRCDSSLYGC